MSQGWICSRLRNRLLKGCVRLISFDRPFRQMPPPSLANWTFHSIRKRWIVRSAFFRKFWGGQSDCKILIWTGVPEKLSLAAGAKNLLKCVVGMNRACDTPNLRWIFSTSNVKIMSCCRRGSEVTHHVIHLFPPVIQLMPTTRLIDCSDPRPLISPFFVWFGFDFPLF